jgi:uncharacterized protein YbjT (DUF2867 family)
VRVLLFGATGTAGGSVLKACLSAPIVEEIRVVTRRALTITDPRLVTYIHQDFTDFTAIAGALDDLAALLYCLGIAVSKVSGEAEYRRITYDYAIAAARILRERSPRAIFHFISGEGASLESRFMWARVKAETERDLLALTGVDCWRPGFIEGERSASAPRFYGWLRPLMRMLSSLQWLYVQGEDVGRAMLQATVEDARGRMFTNAELRAIARRAGPGITGRP